MSSGKHENVVFSIFFNDDEFSISFNIDLIVRPNPFGYCSE